MRDSVYMFWFIYLKNYSNMKVRSETGLIYIQTYPWILYSELRSSTS